MPKTKLGDENKTNQVPYQGVMRGTLLLGDLHTYCSQLDDTQDPVYNITKKIT